MEMIYDEKICVRCLACVSESEFGGVIYERGRIFFDESRAEDWENIISICPVAAINREPSENFLREQTDEPADKNSARSENRQVEKNFLAAHENHRRENLSEVVEKSARRTHSDH